MKKRVLSGIQSTGKLTLGNYLGSIKNWTKMIDEKDCYFMIADLHTLTVRRDAKQLKEDKKSLVALYLACGLDPEKVNIFMQSDVPAHTELSWILACYTYMGELSRMTQFKEKSEKNSDNINAGLFTYPVLMAADILLYDSDEVPVGEDQVQHLEIARDIARRFNQIYGDTFKIPAGNKQEMVRIMGLQNPDKKMSKSSDNPNDIIYVLDSEEEIRNKIKRAVTDSDAKVYLDKEKKAGIYNLLNIYSLIKNINIKEAEEHFSEYSYKDLKEEIADTIIDELKPIKERYLKIYVNTEYIYEVLNKGKEAALKIANKKIEEVYDKIGLTI